MQKNNKNPKPENKVNLFLFFLSLSILTVSPILTLIYFAAFWSAHFWAYGSLFLVSGFYSTLLALLSFILFFFSRNIVKYLFILAFLINIIPAVQYSKILFKTKSIQADARLGCETVDKIAPYIYQWMEHEQLPNKFNVKNLDSSFINFCKGIQGCSSLPLAKIQNKLEHPILIESKERGLAFQDVSIKTELLNSKAAEVFFQYNNYHESLYGKGPDYRRNLTVRYQNCKTKILSPSKKLHKHRYNLNDSLVGLEKIDNQVLKKLFSGFNFTRLLDYNNKEASFKELSLGIKAEKESLTFFLWDDIEVLNFINQSSNPIKTEEQAREILDAYLILRSYSLLTNAKEFYNKLSKQINNNEEFIDVSKSLDHKEAKDKVFKNARSSAYEKKAYKKKGILLTPSKKRGWRFETTILSHVFSQCYSRESVFIAKDGTIEIDATFFVICADEVTNYSNLSTEENLAEQERLINSIPALSANSKNLSIIKRKLTQLIHNSPETISFLYKRLGKANLYQRRVIDSVIKNHKPLALSNLIKSYQKGDTSYSVILSSISFLNPEKELLLLIPQIFIEQRNLLLQKKNDQLLTGSKYNFELSALYNRIKARVKFLNANDRELNYAKKKLSQYIVNYLTLEISESNRWWIESSLDILYILDEIELALPMAKEYSKFKCKNIHRAFDGPTLYPIKEKAVKILGKASFDAENVFPLLQNALHDEVRSVQIATKSAIKELGESYKPAKLYFEMIKEVVN